MTMTLTLDRKTACVNIPAKIVRHPRNNFNFLVLVNDERNGISQWKQREREYYTVCMNNEIHVNIRILQDVYIKHRSI